MIIVYTSVRGLPICILYIYIIIHVTDRREEKTHTLLYALEERKKRGLEITKTTKKERDM